jgi:hypothetical protein
MSNRAGNAVGKRVEPSISWISIVRTIGPDHAIGHQFTLSLDLFEFGRRAIAASVRSGGDPDEGGGDSQGGFHSFSLPLSVGLTTIVRLPIRPRESHQVRRCLLPLQANLLLFSAMLSVLPLCLSSSGGQS